MKSQRNQEVNEGVITNLQRIFCANVNSPLENRYTRMSVISVTRSADDVWGAVDRMDAFTTTRTLIGTRVDVPMRPRGIDPPKTSDTVAHLMCDENMDFIVVNNSLEKGAAEQLPDALPVEKTKWWLQSTYFWHAIDRASRLVGINSSFPKENTVIFSNNAEFFWSVMDIAEKFFRRYLPHYAIGGLYLEPLGVILLFKSSRNAFKLNTAARGLLPDIGQQSYNKSASKQHVIIKKGTPVHMDTYSDELSVPQMLNDLKPVPLFSSAGINSKMLEIMPLQSGSLRNGKVLRANRDIEFDALVYQWNIKREGTLDHNNHEMYHAIDYAFQNRTATFLFTAAFPNYISKRGDLNGHKQETFIITEKSEFMLSFSVIELANIGGIELLGQSHESAFEDL